MPATSALPLLTSKSALAAILTLLLAIEPAVLGLRAALSLAIKPCAAQGESLPDESENEGESEGEEGSERQETVEAKVLSECRRVAAHQAGLSAHLVPPRPRQHLVASPLRQAFRPAPNGLGFPLRR